MEEPIYLESVKHGILIIHEEEEGREYHCDGDEEEAKVLTPDLRYEVTMEILFLISNPLFFGHFFKAQNNTINNTSNTSDTITKLLKRTSMDSNHPI